MKKIGFFGGAFDPPHNGHVALAQAGLNELGLDKLYVVPTGQAWHKARPLSAPEHRLAMARFAFAEMPGVVVDAREIQRPGPTFTIDTLQALQAENPGAQFYLILGADQFAAFKQWHQWQAILEIAIICVAGRAHNAWAQGKNDQLNESLNDPLGDTVNDRANDTLSDPPHDASKLPENRCLELHMPLIDVSATQIRQLLATGLGENQTIADLTAHLTDRLLPDKVARYIDQHQLYSAF